MAKKEKKKLTENRIDLEELWTIQIARKSLDEFSIGRGSENNKILLRFFIIRKSRKNHHYSDKLLFSIFVYYWI